LNVTNQQQQVVQLEDTTPPTSNAGEAYGRGSYIQQEGTPKRQRGQQSE
jgi:hypothetical protein